MNLQTLIFEQCSCQNKNSVFQDPICCGNSVLFSNNGVAGSWWTGGTKMPLMRTSLTFLSSIQNAGWSQATQVQVGKRMMWVRQPGWWNPAWVCNAQLQVNHCSPIGTSLIISPIGQIKNPNNGFYIGWSFFLLFKLAQNFNSQGTLFFCVPFPKGLFFIKKLKLLLRATTYLIIHRFHVMQLNFFFLAEGMLRYIWMLYILRCILRNCLDGYGLGTSFLVVLKTNHLIYQSKELGQEEGIRM
jgi:hypothetical protein